MDKQNYTLTHTYMYIYPETTLVEKKTVNTFLRHLVQAIACFLA